jgi:hypothetical protein
MNYVSGPDVPFEPGNDYRALGLLIRIHELVGGISLFTYMFPLNLP